MSGTRSAARRSEASRWAIAAGAWLLVTPVCIAAVAWSGWRVDQSSHNDLIRGLHDGPNRDAAVEEARSRVLELCRILREIEEEGSRTGRIARHSMAQIRAEVNR